MATVYDTINGYYQQYLGRPMTPQEYLAQTGGGRNTGAQNVAWAQSQIANSEEARNYAASRNTSNAAAPPSSSTNQTSPNTAANGTNPATGDRTTTTTNTGTTGTAGTTTTTAPTFTTTGRGGAGSQNYAYAGFDFNQNASNRDTGKSAKYAFADATREAADAGVAPSTWATKEGAQQFAEQYIRPKLEALGYKVLEIRGDKMRIVTREDVEAGRTAGTWVDFVVNAGGANPQLAWQAETAPDGTDPATSFYTAGATTTPGATTTAPPTSTVPSNETGVEYTPSTDTTNYVPTLADTPYYWNPYN